ncbi:MAG: hypothetical protein Q8N18_06055 [Opitutaceae bacterium]|nr:hypothetical protein [Opitutaceae bacterium]
MSRPKPVIKLGALPRAEAALAAARQMPACRHAVGLEDGAPFHGAKSEVLAYLTSNPEIRVWLLHFMKLNGAIEYHPASQVWIGRAGR